MNKDVDSIVVRLAGDSGDGIQLMGSQFAVSTALSGSTSRGVCACQISFGLRFCDVP